jgi:two-component system, NtrC family, response regulator AtoC
MQQQPFTIFVVEDNEWYNKLLVYTLSLIPDYTVKSFFSGKEILKCIDEAPDVITIDYRLPDMTGDELLQKIKAQNPNIEVIIISEQDDIATAVELLKLGAYDYIVKEKDIRDRLLTTVGNVRKNAKLQQRIVTLEKEVQKKYNFKNTIIGNSPAIEKTLALVEKAVGTNITVSIYGETGTGKEVIAKAIHYNSVRKNKPFVAVNVAALPSELIESELFGYEKGAFTGAAARRIGKFEEADGGTLFLDEIGEMEVAFQAKLLRALQEKEITRLGNNTPVKTDCRIIVATNKNLQELVKQGKFREDLYYRLFGLPIELPPLRERDKDILLLAKFFMDNFCNENNMPTPAITEGAQKKLLGYSFPGNVRELKSVVELAVVMCSGNEITAADITTINGDSLTPSLTEELTLREYNHRILEIYLKKYDNDIKLVAEKLDIGKSTIYRMLKEEE